MFQILFYYQKFKNIPMIHYVENNLILMTLRRLPCNFFR